MILLITLPSLAPGEVVWDSGGFEKPKYQTGELAGQDGWFNSGMSPNELCEIIPDDHGQVLYMKGGNRTTGEVGHGERPFAIKANAGSRKYVFTFKVFPLSGSGAQQLPWFTFVTASKKQITQLANYSGAFFMADQRGNSIMKIDPKTLYQVQIVMNFATQRCEVTIRKLDADGKKVREVKDEGAMGAGVTAHDFPATLVMDGGSVPDNTVEWVGGAYLDDLKLECVE